MILNLYYLAADEKYSQYQLKVHHAVWGNTFGSEVEDHYFLCLNKQTLFDSMTE